MTRDDCQNTSGPNSTSTCPSLSKSPCAPSVFCGASHLWHTQFLATLLVKVGPCHKIRSLCLLDSIILKGAFLLGVRKYKCLATPFCSRGLHFAHSFSYLQSSKDGFARQVLEALNLEKDWKQETLRLVVVERKASERIPDFYLGMWSSRISGFLHRCGCTVWPNA